MQDGFQTANTALIYHANKLLVLHEGDLPYAVRHPSLTSFCHLLSHIAFASVLTSAPLYNGVCPSGMTRLPVAMDCMFWGICEQMYLQ